ncbi:AGAP011749-PA-like protein [Anopheles sinensis]|uniref:AGAP011749-PA-like protein n=1 Tax=Anopheles sinensis TaxID=74873 RepID=A0A084WJ35_ANOSI|nr:AGAP011749-PA-like protein [Anopheles sinensis]
MGAPPAKKPLVNRNLISLKIVLFLFYGALGCLHPYLQKHMTLTGLNYYESQVITLVAPLVAILGPLIIAPLVDRLAGRSGAAFGKRLRLLAAICMILSVVLYSVLFFAVPRVERQESSRSMVSFACDYDGAIIFQQRCSEERTCYQWKREKIGHLTLTNCSYTCQKPVEFENLNHPYTKGLVLPSSTESSLEDEDYDVSDEPLPAPENLLQEPKVEVDKTPIPVPHICEHKGDAERELCHAYTSASVSLKLTTVLRSAVNQENETHSAEWCRYPLDGFSCDIPEKQITWMKLLTQSSNCTPKVECEVHDPYDDENSVLSESVCMRIVGDPEATFWSYLVLRSFGDAFLLAVIVLLNAATIIATRETSTGRGDFGRQIVWGAIGWAVSYFALAWFFETYYAYVVLTLLAALVLLVSTGMPLTPPEMWWHTKCGMVAIPMSAIRRYGPESAGLCLVTLVLGTFWAVLDNYEGVLVKSYDIHPSTSDYYGQVWSAFVVLGALLAIPTLWYAENIVDFCGHSNILITAITTFIFRFALLATTEVEWWRVVIDFLYPVTLGLTWLTIVFYMRHIMPRRLVTTGQALPVIFHFCLGRFLGALIGMWTKLDHLIITFQALAISACVISAVYFLLYHLVLAPRCAARLQHEPSASALNITAPDSATHTNGQQAPLAQPVSQTNGSYQPLRIYHNYRGRKGHFRY